MFCGRKSLRCSDFSCGGGSRVAIPCSAGILPASVTAPAALQKPPAGCRRYSENTLATALSKHLFWGKKALNWRNSLANCGEEYSVNQGTAATVIIGHVFRALPRIWTRAATSQAGAFSLLCERPFLR